MCLIAVTPVGLFNAYCIPMSLIRSVASIHIYLLSTVYEGNANPRFSKQNKNIDAKIIGMTIPKDYLITFKNALDENIELELIACH